MKQTVELHLGTAVWRPGLQHRLGTAGENDGSVVVPTPADGATRNIDCHLLSRITTELLSTTIATVDDDGTVELDSDQVIAGGVFE